MTEKDPRIDAYITLAPEFARPILVKLRELVHRGCPEVVETTKWSAPAFDFHGPMVQMAAFKAHCLFGFWKEKLVFVDEEERELAGLMRRLGSLDDLPAERRVVAWVKRAAAVNVSGAKVARPKAKPKPRIVLPEELSKAFATKKHAKAKKAYDALSPSHRREYLEWIVEAKRDDTRARRIVTTLAWLAEGKTRNWKYERK